MSELPSAPTSSSVKTPRGEPRARIRSGPQTKTARTGLPPFQRLIDTYSNDVWRMLVASVGRDDADDCFQETFISALRAYPRLRRDSNLRAWILTIAHNKALDTHRARARHVAPVAEIGEVADRNDHAARGDANRTTPAGAPPSVDRDETVWQAVRTLPDRQRSAVVLRFVGDLPHREIAAAIGCSEEAARRSLHEGLTTLRREVSP